MTNRSSIDKQIAKGELSKYGIGKQAPAPVQDDLDIPDFLRRDKPQHQTKHRVVNRRLNKVAPQPTTKAEPSFKQVSVFEVEVSDEDLGIIAKQVQTALGNKLEEFNVIYKDGKSASLFFEIIKGFVVNECKHLDNKVYRYIVKGE